MKQLVPLLLTAAVCCSLAAAHAATKPAQAVKPPPPPDYFPLRQDYWWKYEIEASTGKSGYLMKVVNVEKKEDGTIEYDMHTQPDAPAANGFDEWYVKPKGW